MKLLLTSGGLRNQTIVRALLNLLSQPIESVNVAFIPTAMHPEPGDKGWMIDQFIGLRDLGVAQVDIVDIAVLSKDVWLQRLQESNVIFVNGGNTSYLMEQMRESGFAEEIESLLQDRVYIGSSAGSYVATPDTRLNSDSKETIPALGLVDFGIQAHLKSPKFQIAKDEATIRKRVADCPYIVYALDDEMAIKIDDDNMEIVGEGTYLKIDPAA